MPITPITTTTTTINTDRSTPSGARASSESRIFQSARRPINRLCLVGRLPIPDACDAAIGVVRFTYPQPGLGGIGADPIEETIQSTARRQAMSAPHRRVADRIAL